MNSEQQQLGPNEEEAVAGSSSAGPAQGMGVTEELDSEMEAEEAAEAEAADMDEECDDDVIMAVADSGTTDFVPDFEPVESFEPVNECGICQMWLGPSNVS